MATQCVVLKKTLEWGDDSFSGEEGNISELVADTSLPLHYVLLKLAFGKGKVLVGVSEKLSIDGVDILLGNYLAECCCARTSDC